MTTCEKRPLDRSTISRHICIERFAKKLNSFNNNVLQEIGTKWGSRDPVESLGSVKYKHLPCQSYKE